MIKKHWLYSLAITALVLLIVGCRSEENPLLGRVEVVVPPPPCRIVPNGKITVEAKDVDVESFVWKSEIGGVFSPPDELTSTYTAPNLAEDTPFQIWVVNSSDQRIAESITCLLQTEEIVVRPSIGATESSATTTPIPISQPTTSTVVEVTETSSATTTPIPISQPTTPPPTNTPDVSTFATATATTIAVTAAPTRAIRPVSAVAVAEEAGQCGASAFNEDLNNSNLIFSRPEGHTSGWISSDAATVILPDGKSESFTTQFVLIVDDLNSVQLQGVGLNEQGSANSWGCWFRDSDTELVTEGAAIEYQKKIAYGQTAQILQASSDGLVSFDPDSELSTHFRTIPAFAINGVEWCAGTTNTYSVGYEKGAYSGWPSDLECPNSECWKTGVFGYKDREIEWVNTSGVEEPGNPDIVVGWNLPAQPTVGEVTNKTRILRPQRIEMKSGNCLIFVPMDSRLSYGDNRGDVTIAISPAS